MLLLGEKPRFCGDTFLSGQYTCTYPLYIRVWNPEWTSAVIAAVASFHNLTFKKFGLQAYQAVDARYGDMPGRHRLDGCLHKSPWNKNCLCSNIKERSRSTCGGHCRYEAGQVLVRQEVLLLRLALHQQLHRRVQVAHTEQPDTHHSYSTITHKTAPVPPEPIFPK